MEFTTALLYERDLFVRTMATYIPGAKAWTEIRGWEDPRPQFVIQFKNSVRFEGDRKLNVINDAKAYYETVKALTGEYP